MLSLALALLSLGAWGYSAVPAEFSPSQQRKLKDIARMAWEKKSEAKILAAWGLFVDQEKASRPDFKAAIVWIFQVLKATGEQNAELAKTRSRQVEALKAEIDSELASVRRARSQLEKRQSPFPLPRKRFEFNKEEFKGFVIKDDGLVMTAEALRVYEGYITWGGKEANLAGTGGVALLEYAKDAIQTAVSNISGVGSLAIQMKKIVERKLCSTG